MSLLGQTSIQKPDTEPSHAPSSTLASLDVELFNVFHSDLFVLEKQIEKPEMCAFPQSSKIDY